MRSSYAFRTLAAALLVLSLAACSDDEPRPAPGPVASEAENLEALPGVNDALVEDVDWTEGGPPVTTATVAVQPTISSDELTNLLTLLDDVAPRDHLVVIGKAAPERLQSNGMSALERYIDNDPAEPTLRAETWLDAMKTFPDAAVKLSSRLHLDLRLPDEASIAAAADDGRATSWMVNINSTTVSGLADGIAQRFSVKGALTPAHLREWTKFHKTAQQVAQPVAVSGLRFSSGLDDPETSNDLLREATLALPRRIAKQALTPANYGDLIWPLVDAQLTEFADEPNGSVYKLNVKHKVPGQGTAITDNLIYLTLGSSPAGPDESGRRWNEQAAQRLADISR